MYFGDFVTTISTLLVFLEVGMIGYTFAKRSRIQYWGRRTLIVGMLGLVICCFVAARDSYHMSVQSMFDASIEAGLFATDSIQSNLCCIGGAIITFAGLSSLVVKKQRHREIMFYLMSCVFIAKTFIIEISRWVVL